MNLTQIYRPNTFSDMTGQPHLVGENGILTNMLRNQTLTSCIFYGPPGCGKTTAANILSAQMQYPLTYLNATNASTADIKKAAASGTTDTPILLYLDEIQYFNKKQQQCLLPYLESGILILIAATTDNPYYCCIDALLSRCNILEFKTLSTDDIHLKLNSIIDNEHRNIDFDATACIAEQAAGDMRRALNLLELVFQQIPETESIHKPQVQALLPTARMSGFDMDGNTHFALISALQKSIRGSDPNAAIFYLARLLEGGDILSPCRRLMVIANEDIGLADPNAIPFTYACVEMAKQLGLPEANKPLTNAVLYLAIAKKASTCEDSYNAAADAVKKGKGREIPPYLHHACSKGYLYPHDYPNHWIPQQYLPNDIQTDTYYTPGDNLFEHQQAAYWNTIRQNYRPVQP